MAKTAEAGALTVQDELNRIDPEREAYYQSKLGRALDKIKPKDKVLVVCHPDADGSVGGAIVASYLQENKPETQVGICHHLLNSQAFYETAKEYDHIIVSDLWVDSNEGQQEYLRCLLAEGKNITIFDHHDKNFPAPKDTAKIAHSIPETITNGLVPADPQKGLGEFIYITPNRLKSPIENALTGALITYIMLAPHSKTRLKEVEKWLPISISGDYARESWTKLLEECADAGSNASTILETLGYALNASHALKNPSRVVEALKNSKSVEQLVEQPEIKALLSILDWIRAEIRKVLPQLEGKPFLTHAHITKESLQATELQNPLVANTPRISNVYADELRKLLREKIVIATQNRGEVIKSDFRSSNGRELFNTRRLARKLKGGGHHKASGADLDLTEQTEAQALEKVRAMVDEENANFTELTASPEFERLNPEAAAYYEHKAREFIDSIPFGAEILLACHPDMDGVGGASLVEALLTEQRPDIKIAYCYSELDTEEFFEAAQNCNHIITLDLWIPTLREDQENLRTLLKNGKNIAVFDHHDVHLKAFDPNKPHAVDAPYDHESPETLANGLPGEIYFISPRRLGSTMGNPQNFTATAVAYRILSRLEPSLVKRKLAVLLSVLGDKADESWSTLIGENEEGFDDKARIARVINLAKNLKPEYISRIIKALSAGKSASEILEMPEVNELRLMRRWMKKRAAEIAVAATVTTGATAAGTTETATSGAAPSANKSNDGLFFFYQITKEDEKNFRAAVPGCEAGRFLNNDPCLCSGLSYAIGKAIGKNQIAVVSQITKQEGHYLIRYSLHTEGKEEGYNAGHYAIMILNGGGKDMAGGGKQKAATFEEAQRKVWAIRRHLKHLGHGTHP